MKIINELENILISLKSIDENNFELNFYPLKNRMIQLKEEIIHLEKSQFLEQNPEIKEKIDYTSKLISEEYDNKLKIWTKKLSRISEMLISSSNKKKILSYMR